MTVRLAFIVFALWSAPALAQTPAPDMTTRELYAIVQERSNAINQRFVDEEKAVSAALAAAEKAVLKAEVASDKRLELLNELRGTVTDLTKTLASIAYVDVRFKGMDEKINAIEVRQAAAISQTEGSNWLWGVLIGGLGLLCAAIAVAVSFLRKTAPH